MRWDGSYIMLVFYSVFIRNGGAGLSLTVPHLKKTRFYDFLCRSDSEASNKSLLSTHFGVSSQQLAAHLRSRQEGDTPRWKRSSFQIRNYDVISSGASHKLCCTKEEPIRTKGIRVARDIRDWRDIRSWVFRSFGHSFLSHQNIRILCKITRT